MLDDVEELRILLRLVDQVAQLTFHVAERARIVVAEAVLPGVEILEHRPHDAGRPVHGELDVRVVAYGSLSTRFVREHVTVVDVLGVSLYESPVADRPSRRSFTLSIAHVLAPLS